MRTLSCEKGWQIQIIISAINWVSPPPILCLVWYDDDDASNLHTTYKLFLGVCIILGNVYFKIQEVTFQFAFHSNRLEQEWSSCDDCPCASLSVEVTFTLDGSAEGKRQRRRWHIDDKLLWLPKLLPGISINLLSILGRCDLYQTLLSYTR